MNAPSLENTKVTIVGIGRTAVGCARLLIREGATVFATDAGDGPGVQSAKSALEAAGVACEVGGHSDRALDSADLIVVSPGVPVSIPLLTDARGRGIEIVGELELASRYCEAPIIAVTGTNGKSTVTEWVHHCLKRGGVRSSLSGNNAVPLSGAVMDDGTPDVYVVEVSSYALESVSSFHPRAAAVLNLTPDHLARHGTIDNYARAKARIFEQMDSGDAAVLNADDEYVWAMGDSTRAAVIGFSKNRRVSGAVWIEDGTIRDDAGLNIDVSALSIPGAHNAANALAVIGLLRGAGYLNEETLQGLFDFPGVEHRIEYVTELDGVVYYNDSKSTNIDSLAVALEAFDAPIVLIAGGEGKGADYAPLSRLMAERVKHLITIGADAATMESAWGDCVRFTRAGDMDVAVHLAEDIAREGDVVLLSPGCASFDMYQDFEARGRHFKEIVNGLRAGIGT